VSVTWNADKCWCYNCNHPPEFPGITRFVVCPECGHKRCPKATSHDNKCTKSNEPGQVT